MNWFPFALECYFAVTLATSGLAKIDAPTSFEKTLLQQHILPAWSTKVFSRLFPWIEILIACLLVVDIWAKATAILLLGLFLIFLGVNLFLFLTNSTANCGCLEQVETKIVDALSITISVIFAFIAALHLWLVFILPPVNLIWRVIGLILLIGAGSFLLRKVTLKRRSKFITLAQQSSNTDSGKQAPLFAGIDQKGRNVLLEDYRGQWLFLMFVLPGCPACPRALTSLQQMLQEERSIQEIVIGSSSLEVNQAYATEIGIDIPLLAIEDSFVAEVYQIHNMPYIFLIDETGKIRAKGIANQPAYFQSLLKIAGVILSPH